jgi:hypothetical protein
VTKRDTELLEVGFREMRKRPKINVILDEGFSVLAETELTEPILNRLHRRPFRLRLQNSSA